MEVGGWEGVKECSEWECGEIRLLKLTRMHTHTHTLDLESNEVRVEVEGMWDEMGTMWKSMG